MECEIIKGKPLTKEETQVLLDLVEASKIITTKTTNATNNKLKTAEWKRLSERFNATAANCPRTPAQLRLKWENLKKNARKRSTKIRMNQIKTGGGPAEYIPPDDILDRVTGLLGSTASGFSVLFGGDKEQKDNSPNVECCSGDGDDNGGGLGEARVIIESQDGVLEPIEVVDCADGSGGGSSASGCQVLNIVDMNVTTPHKRKFTFNTPRVNKKLKNDDGRTARNQAIREYFDIKKQCLSAKLENISLENNALNLRNTKLMLEVEKLKFELEKLRQQ